MKKKAMYLVDGDVFEYQGRIEVAISDYCNGSVWVSSMALHEEARKAPYYTNSALLVIDGETIVECKNNLVSFSSI